MPGCIDPNVHLDLLFMGIYSSDNHKIVTHAALHGGTMIIDFIIQKQGNSSQAALEQWRSRSDNNCLGDYSFQRRYQL